MLDLKYLRQEKISPREYQSEIAESALANGNTLAVLPTGLGKTIIALMLISTKFDSQKSLFLAPTKPLAQQHYAKITSEMLVGEGNVALVSGEIPPTARAPLWQRKIVISTPQTLKNDIERGRTTFDFGLCIFDEAHRSVGNYAYTFIASECAKSSALILGITASPGGDRKKISEITTALNITNVQIRGEEDSSVAKYLKPLDVSWVPVEMGAGLRRACGLVREASSGYAETLRKLGFPVGMHSKKALLELRNRIVRLPDKRKYAALSIYTTLFNLVHMGELLETQGTSTFLKYLAKLRSREEKSKGVMRILGDRRIAETETLLAQTGEHPKLQRLVELVKARRSERIIVFAQYRAQIERIAQEFAANGIPAMQFVGKRDGVTQKEQKATIEKFRAGGFRVLVASSIGEEGLDIPAVDTVIFYEPVPSEIRSIQRRGRAGRLRAGRVFILYAKGTRDEAFLWSSRKKEGRMRQIMKGMQNKTKAAATPPPPSRVFENRQGTKSAGKPGQKKISDFL